MRPKLIFLLILTTGGLLFSGYLSAVKFFTNTCVFGEACPYFLGYPACWYGFGMYLLMWLVTLGGMAGVIKGSKVFLIDSIVSFLGILFAGRFVILEIMSSRVTGVLGLSTCAYGLIFYVAIFIAAVIAFREARSS